MVLPFEYETYITCCLACSGGGGAGKRLGASEKKIAACDVCDMCECSKGSPADQGSRV